jgi:hypothetical protein
MALTTPAIMAGHQGPSHGKPFGAAPRDHLDEKLCALPLLGGREAVPRTERTHRIVVVVRFARARTPGTLIARERYPVPPMHEVVPAALPRPSLGFLADRPPHRER